MAKLSVTKATTTGLDNSISDYSVASQALDYQSAEGETYWNFDEAAQNFGYYKQIPELKKAIDALASWTVGKGWRTPSRKHEVLLNNLRGWGEDTIDNIFWNMIVVKKVVGDAFAEIVRNENGTMINLKPISPERVRLVLDNKGSIKRYDVLQRNKAYIPLKPQDMLHLSNDRVGDEIHGTSVIDSCLWVIKARNEAMETYKKIMKRSLALGALYVDTDDQAKLNHIKQQYKEAVENGEVLVMPMDIAELKDTKVTVQDFVTWIQYLENFFYQAVGIPKIILGGSEQFTEASSKIGYLTFEQVYISEQRQLEQDIKNKLAIEITFERPVSLKDNMQNDEAANTGQVGFQPKEVNANLERE